MAKALALAGIFYEDVGMMKVRHAARVEWCRFSLPLPLTSLPCSLPAVCPWLCIMRPCPHASPPGPVMVMMMMMRNCSVATGPDDDDDADEARRHSACVRGGCQHLAGAGRPARQVPHISSPYLGSYLGPYLAPIQ